MPGGEPGIKLVLDVLQRLDRTATERGFLQQMLQLWLGLSLSEQESAALWQEMTQHRHELSEKLHRPMTLLGAAADYLSAKRLLHDPVLVEYEHLNHLRHDAATDALTGLYNRRLFEEYCAKEIARSKRHTFPLGVLLWDLRHFKRVNDTFGHAGGDRILRAVSEILKETVRQSDFVCRLGGDEFAAVIPQSRRASVYVLVQRVLDKFDKVAGSLAPGVTLGLNCGAASYPEDGDTVERLFEVADQRLYAEKQLHLTPGETPSRSPLATWKTEEPFEETERIERSDRRWSRVLLTGSGASVMIDHDGETGEAEVIDLSVGGIGFRWKQGGTVPDQFRARLRLPFFAEPSNMPAYELQARRVYTREEPDGAFRIGCHFVS